MEKRLHLSNTDRKFAGVCGGLAEYFGIDSNLVRIGWVAFTLLGGAGGIAYVIAWILMPRDEEEF